MFVKVLISYSVLNQEIDSTKENRKKINNLFLDGKLSEDKFNQIKKF